MLKHEKNTIMQLVDVTAVTMSVSFPNGEK